jgi:hypothetical protein
MDKSNNRDAAHAMFGLGRQSSEAPEPARPSAPGPAQAPPPAAPWSFSGGQILFLLVILLLIVSGLNLYLLVRSRQQFNEHASKEADQLDLLTRRLDSSDARYAQLRGQFQVTSEKLGFTEQELSRARALAVTVQKQQQESTQRLGEAIAKKAGAEEVNKLQAESTEKFGVLSGDIAGTRKDLEATKEALMGTKGELSGAIARTHDELVALAHRTDRDYFEFSLGRRKAQQKVGTVMVELVRTNPKKNQFTVYLYADDKRVERKDKAINEPVYFYVQGASSALELVVNKLGKESVSGYMSAPRGFFPSTPNVLTARPGA